MIWPRVEGRGIALEAVHAVRGWCYDELGWQTAVTYVDPKNLSSVRLCERLGAELDAAAETIDSHDVVYRHPSPARLKSGQLSDGIQMEIRCYSDPLFKSKGVPLD